MLADAAIDLGRRTGVDEYVCWGRWRMDAYAELGNRLDLTAELAALTPIVERLDKPACCQAQLLLVKASARLLEGRFAEAAAERHRTPGRRSRFRKPASGTGSSRRPWPG